MKKIVALIIFFLCYSISILPFIVHANLMENTGFIKDLKVVSTDSLPEDIRDASQFKEECTLILLESGSGKRTVVITDESLQSFSKGDIIKITDKIEDWYVDWHAYDFFGESFSNIVIDDVETLESFESTIEEIIYSPYGSAIFSLSKIVFFFAPLLVIYFAYSFKKRFCLWSVSTSVYLYSLEVFFYNIIAYLHQVPVSELSKYFGYLFFFLIPITFLLLRFEESDEGQEKLKEFYSRLEELIIG